MLVAYVFALLAYRVKKHDPDVGAYQVACTRL
jgi:hypothetical protein